MSPQWVPAPHLVSDRATWRDRFFSLSTTRELADLLEVEYRDFVWIVFRNRPNYYVHFEIPKRAGGSRLIKAPTGSLKILQRKLLEILAEVYQQKPPVHGFSRERSIVTNAMAHRQSNYVLNVDLEEFFPTIHFGRVRGLFRSRPYNRPDEVATALAAICCVDDCLPQGAPTSPIVSNMLCGQLDSQLLRLAAAYDCTYTRYADDITISTRRRTFPTPIARKDPNDSAHTVLGATLQTIIQQNGFAVNEAKVRLQHRHQRQVVTGLVVNERPNVPRRLVRQIRSMLHAWERYGLTEAQREFSERWDYRSVSRRRPDTSFIDVLQGRIAFVSQVRGKGDPTANRLRARYRSLSRRDLTEHAQPRLGLYVAEDRLFRALDPEWSTPVAEGVADAGS